MPEEDILRRLARVEAKLDEKVVYQDVYKAEKEALRDTIAGVARLASSEIVAATGRINDRVDGVVEDVDDLKAWRKTIYALIATSYVGLLATILMYLLQNSAGR